MVRIKLIFFQMKHLPQAAVFLGLGQDQIFGLMIQCIPENWYFFISK